MTTPPETEYVPSFATVIEVCVHDGAVSTGLTPHNLSVEASSDAPPAAESFDNGLTVCVSPFCAADSSARSVGGGSVVTEIVLRDFEPLESAITYDAVDVPTNPAAPVNVTTPFDTVYVPSPAMETDVCVQSVSVSTGDTPQSRTLDAESVAPDAAVSLVAGDTVIAVATAPDAESGRAVGGTAHWMTIMP